MNDLISILVVVIIMSDFLLLAAGSLRAAVRIIGFQGLALGVLPLCAHQNGLTLRLVAIAILVIILKAVVFPRLLLRSLRESGAPRTITFFVGPVSSLLLGIFVLGSSLWWGYLLPLPERSPYTLAVPMVFFTIVTGLLLLVSRRQALMQVIGYLALENGIYAFGVFFAQSESMLIELGILLDVFVGVFIMGIMVFHISREFDNIESSQLSTLRDWFRGSRRPAGGGGTLR
ncbi:MAG TPA: hydrogenase [bacterium]|nr:hydrogenase [bacterium]